MVRGEEGAAGEAGRHRGGPGSSAVPAGLHDATRRFVRGETAETVAAYLVDAAADLLGGPETTVVYRHDPAAAVLRPVAHAQEAPDGSDDLCRLVADPATSLTAATFASGETVLVADAGADPRLSEEDPVDCRGLFVPLGDHGVLVAGDDEAGRFDDRTVGFVEMLASDATIALDRVRGETDRRRLDRELETLADLYALIGDVYAAAVRRSTKEEVERLLCERLADADAYDLAWIAGLDRAGDGFAIQARASEEFGLDGDDEWAGPDGDGPTRRALGTQELQVRRVTADESTGGGTASGQSAGGGSVDRESVGGGSTGDAWDEWAHGLGVRAVAAVPMVHGGTLHGVLTLCSDRPTAFDDRERELVARLGEFVGHAFAAIEHRTALTSDEVVELELRLPRMLEAISDGGGMAGRVDIDRTVPVGDGTFVQYATATPEAVADFESLLSALPHVEEVARVADRADEVRYRFEQSDPPLMSIVADEGGLVRGSVIEDGDFDMYVDLPQGADVRSIVETLQESYPDVELVAQRRAVHRESPRETARAALADELTDRQRAVLECAYYAGFFNWPRDTTAEELAETMSISSPTLHHHLRKALQKVLAAIFERGPADRDVLT